MKTNRKDWWQEPRGYDEIIEKRIKTRVLIGWIILYILILILAISTCIRKNSLYAPPGYNPSRVNDSVIDRRKCQSTQRKYCQKRIGIIIINSNPHRGTINRYIFR